MADSEYWFCLEHHRVEERGGCRNVDRLGPYATHDEASRALEKVAENNARWDADDDWGAQPGSASTDGGTSSDD